MNLPSRLAPIDIGVISHDPEAIQRPLPDDLRLCMMSLYRTAASDLLLDQNLALWDAVEFYAANVKVPGLFSRADHKKLMRYVISTSEWSGAQRKRLLQAKQMLNAPPLLSRLRRRLDVDSVPYTEAEFEAVSRLRSERNDWVHGREAADSVDSADLRIATQLMARALVYSAARRE